MDVIGKMFVIQVKFGVFFCIMDMFMFWGFKNYFEYWCGYFLFVFGVVYDLDERKGYWVNFSDFIGNCLYLIEEGFYSFIFQKIEMCLFILDIFEKIIKLQIFNEKISIFLEQVWRFFVLEDYVQYKLGFDLFVVDYVDNLVFWEDLFFIFRNRDVFFMVEEIIYCLVDVVLYLELYQFLESKFFEKLVGRICCILWEFLVWEVVKVFQVYDEDDWVE